LYNLQIIGFCSINPHLQSELDDGARQSLNRVVKRGITNQGRGQFHSTATIPLQPSNAIPLNHMIFQIFEREELKN